MVLLSADARRTIRVCHQSIHSYWLGESHNELKAAYCHRNWCRVIPAPHSIGSRAFFNLGGFLKGNGDILKVLFWYSSRLQNVGITAAEHLETTFQSNYNCLYGSQFLSTAQIRCCNPKRNEGKNFTTVFMKNLDQTTVESKRLSGAKFYIWSKCLMIFCMSSGNHWGRPLIDNGVWVGWGICPPPRFFTGKSNIAPETHIIVTATTHNKHALQAQIHIHYST